jgi:hypothetical protein
VNRPSFLTLCALFPIAASTAARAETMPETLLGWARKLVAEVIPANNIYGSHPTYVEWSDAATGSVARNRSVCSSFANHLLERSFGYTPHDLGAWFGKPVPLAVDYHATIAAGNGFERIVHVAAIRPGDIIAIAFPPGSNPTGHVMIAASQARPRAPSAPIESDTHQYEIDVIDSANSGHGGSDTRRRADGGWTTGVGQGVLRLYARPDDTIAGYAWSPSVHSLFRSSTVRRPTIGRLDPARVPPPSGSPGTNAGDPEDPASADGAAPTDT